MRNEPAIYPILRADHVDGFHSEPNVPNKYCPMCMVDSIEEFVQLEGSVYVEEPRNE